MSKYEAAIAEMDTKNGVIFLNDLFGGSPYNAACRLAIGNENYGIVTGVNLPMLIETIGLQLTARHDMGIEIIEKAVAAGQAAYRPFTLVKSKLTRG